MKGILASALVCVAIAILTWSFWPRQPPTSINVDEEGSALTEATSKVAYLCRETGEVFQLAEQSSPAVNPKTGRRTLLRALYCPTCRKWMASPPPEASDRQAVGPRCPKHGTPLAITASP